MDVEQLDKACREYPVVQELLKDNMHLSLSALAHELRNKLACFDDNHTHAQARLSDRIDAVSDHLKALREGTLRLADRIKELESQNSDTTEPEKPPEATA